MTLLLALVIHALPADAAAWSPGGRSQAEDLVISVVTFGPGPEIPMLWGHTALVVVDKKLSVGRLYNYGAFAFGSDFLVQFLAGRPEFLVEEAGIMFTYAEYRELDRTITVQDLALTPEQALKAANALAVNVLPENCRYRYHPFDDNCSTRPRDLIDLALDGALSRATSGPARMSLRDHLRRYSQAFPPVALGLDYINNDQADRPITVRDEAFLPDELARQLDALVIDGHPAVREKTTLYQSKTMPAPPATAPQWTGWLAAISLLAGAGLLALSRSKRRAARLALGGFLALAGGVWGLSGLLLFVMGTLTDNLVTHHNENLFFINPLTLALLPLGVMLMRGSPRAPRALKWVTAALCAIALLGVALKALPAFDQRNWNIIAMVVPFALASALAFARRAAPGAAGERVP